MKHYFIKLAYQNFKTTITFHFRSIPCSKTIYTIAVLLKQFGFKYLFDLSWVTRSCISCTLFLTRPSEYTIVSFKTQFKLCLLATVHEFYLHGTGVIFLSYHRADFTIYRSALFTKTSFVCWTSPNFTFGLLIGRELPVPRYIK